MIMRKQFKNISAVDFPFCRSGETVMLEVDKDGLLGTREQRERQKHGHLIEVKVSKPKTETKGANNVIN
jgi:hypothetical protein